MPDTTKRLTKPLLTLSRRRPDAPQVVHPVRYGNRELASLQQTQLLIERLQATALTVPLSLGKACQQIAQTVIAETQYPFLAVFSRSSISSGHFTLQAWSGHKIEETQPLLPGFSHQVQIAATSPWLSRLTDNQFIALEQLPLGDITGLLGCSEADIRHFQHFMRLKTLQVARLSARGHVLGFMVAGFTGDTEQVVATDSQLLGRIRSTASLIIDRQLLFEENKRVERQVKSSTAKLVALDEAKDDFVSMASHQLRTPLTSVKGYLSMVLEGDAGKVTPMQRQMLGQAFFSSQRMVYLIADLLNVSRLRTGKFIIETAPVNLATVVNEEIGQLQETAKSRSLKLSYKKPKKFPEVLLDETKTRQIIMNFVDNAIYYTPAGGHVEVELVDKPTTVELRVKDTGIGVPKSDQHHLFTKFYRAGNARQARPDGTGLGLYMAKKVIIDQGGAIIFDSHEGKGSTFGFIFRKGKAAREAGKA